MLAFCFTAATVLLIDLAIVVTGVFLRKWLFKRALSLQRLGWPAGYRLLRGIYSVFRVLFSNLVIRELDRVVYGDLAKLRVRHRARIDA